MQTDSLFYRLFQTAPFLFFELIGQAPENSEAYQFGSVELKQTAFRIDGVFLPTTNSPDAPVYFVEVQFQRDQQLYRRLFAEIFLYLRQYPTINYWRAVIIYPDRTTKPDEQEIDTLLLNSPLIEQVYLQELGTIANLSTGMGVLRLIVEPPENAAMTARLLIDRIRQAPPQLPAPGDILELIETIVVYKFPQLSRQEIEAMLGLSELRQTRIYQEALAEGREEGREAGREEGREAGERSLIQRLLNRRFGAIPESLQTRIQQLPLRQIEALGEALLDFASLDELAQWVSQHTSDPVGEEE